MTWAIVGGLQSLGALWHTSSKRAGMAIAWAEGAALATSSLPAAQGRSRAPGVGHTIEVSSWP